MEQNKNLPNETVIQTDITNQPKSFSMDKSSILVMILLFMFSSKLWDIAWDIGKSLLYIIIILYLLSYINQDLADNIKNIIHDFTNVNANSNFVTDMLAKISSKVSNLLSTQKQKKPEVLPVDNVVEGFTTKTHPSLYDGTSGISGCIGKNLANIPRSDSKNIFY